MGRNPPKEADHVRISFARQPELTVNWCDVGRVTIDVLPDVALLEIFDFYVDEEDIESWHTLVHVSRKWRNLVLGSPRRLNLRLCCTARMPVRKTLDVWPSLPIVVMSYGHNAWDGSNIIATLEHIDRIRGFSLFGVPSSLLETVLAVMQQPYPALTDLKLHCEDETMLHIPDSFLGASAPRLQLLKMNCVSFPGLPKLLLSSTHLVTLLLRDIPYSGYISPEAMVTGLSALTKLERLDIRFKSPRHRPDRRSRRPPSSIHTRLPALTRWWFKGASDYLEDLVARIDAPILDGFYITFFHQLVLDTPQLAQFISRTPNFKTQDKLCLSFSNSGAWITLPHAFTKEARLELKISCEQSDWQLSSLAQICHSSFPQILIATVQHLHISEDRFSPLDWRDDIDNDQWLEVLHPFTVVKGLYISREFVPRIAPALKELVGERVNAVLPALKTLFLDDPQSSGPVQDAVGQFVTTRQISGHPIVVSRWDS